MECLWLARDGVSQTQSFAALCGTSTNVRVSAQYLTKHEEPEFSARDVIRRVENDNLSLDCVQRPVVRGRRKIVLICGFNSAGERMESSQERSYLFRI